MKDMMGIELEVGMHVFYFKGGPGGFVQEEAKVIFVRDKSIKVEFLGNLSHGRKKGDQGNIFNTTGKVFIRSPERDT